MASTRDWLEGARPRTLPLSISPVIAGSAVALAANELHPTRALLALIVSVAMQLGVNYANDYSDGIRGTDAHRIGPKRLVGSGAATPKAVKTAAFTCFAIGCTAGLALVILTQLWWIIAVGVAIVAAAWFYTAGPHPYGYHALGELSVLIFFGLVAVGGTVLVQTPTFPLAETLTVALAQGTGATAVLVVNNLRDIPSDTAAGKRTLAVLLADAPTRHLFTTLTAISLAASIAAALLITPWMLLCLAMVPFYYLANLPVINGETGLSLVRSLKLVGLGQLTGAIGLLAGAAISTL